MFIKQQQTIDNNYKKDTIQEIKKKWYLSRVSNTQPHKPLLEVLSKSKTIY